jgi:hypothetical protein
MVICLGWPSPATSSSLPAACAVGVGHTSPLIWPCSDWGLPCRRCCQRRGGLLPHRFTLTRRLPAGRSVFCGPVRRLSAPRRYLAVYPLELGLSSSASQRPRPSRSASGGNIVDRRAGGQAGRRAGGQEGREVGGRDHAKLDATTTCHPENCGSAAPIRPPHPLSPSRLLAFPPSPTPPPPAWPAPAAPAGRTAAALDPPSATG